MVTPGGTRPSSRADRRLRFAELEPQDVHVYESVPSSPKRTMLALPPPDPSDDSSTISLGQWKGKMLRQQPPSPHPNNHMQQDGVEAPEEGSAEDIRRRFFPLAPTDDPNIAWMEFNSAPPPTESDASSLRFDLQGNPIPPSVSLSLPTHLGLHHHAEGDHAGYTLDDIFLLSRSTVPAQRATMLGILARITRRLANVKIGIIDGMDEVVGKEEELRTRILGAGVEAMSNKGSVGALAIEVVWECIVGWDPSVIDVEGVELDSPRDVAINSLHLDFFFPQIATILTQGDVFPESSTQLLSILHRLAQQSNAIADKIVSTPNLLGSIVQTFLLTPIPTENTSPLPNPFVLQLLYTLALSSRPNAQEIEIYADSLLRFVTFSAFSSPYPPALATNLLAGTLRLFRALASYGFYSHIAATAIEQLAHIEQHVVSEACHSQPLTIAWANLVETWTVCAIDPHQTTPPHDITWTQIVGWAWHESVLALQDRLEVDEKNWPEWSASWRAQAVWLEGSKVNAIKGGEAERLDVINSIKAGFENGKEFKVLNTAVTTLQKELVSLKEGDVGQLKKMASHVGLLTSAVRLWLACIAPHTDGPPPSPPFILPFAGLSELARSLIVHPLWSTLPSLDTSLGYFHCKKLSAYLSYYLWLSRRLPGTSQSLWLAQAFSILLRLMPGDEDAALLISKDVISMLTPSWAMARNLQVPSQFWERRGLSVLEPFIINRIRRQENVYIGPLITTPQSIKHSTTQRLPLQATISQLGLPLHPDWTMSPLEHLLRSGESAVFKALPTSWDASEVEVARASLFLTKIVQEALLNFSMTSLVLTREEAVFGCMKVFMLEHDQPQSDSSDEVFRDNVVGHFMEDILRPYSLGSADSWAISSVRKEDLEKVASRFLGPSVPFFQFYTDFVALYDAISFSHRIFSLLLLPPTSMRYPLDYRKHLWCDFNHVIRTIRVSPLQVLSADVREYLYPIETEPQVIASYLNSLLQNNAHDFMGFVALHHISSNIWPDLRGTGDVENEERASTLLKTVVHQGNIDLVRQVVMYRQTISESVLLPPSCFSKFEEVRTLRLECVLRWGGQAMINRLKGLFSE